MSLYERYLSSRGALMKSMWKSNIHEVPKLSKIVVAMWIWSLATRKWTKDFSDLQENLRKITGQHPQMILSKKSVSNFKLREWMPAMLKCTLRWASAYEFLNRLVILTFPRLRDFSWLTMKKFDWRWNYTLWFKDLSWFPELTPEELKTPMWLQVTICTTASNSHDAKWLLQSLWVVFEKKELLNT